MKDSKISNLFKGIKEAWGRLSEPDDVASTEYRFSGPLLDALNEQANMQESQESLTALLNPDNAEKEIKKPQVTSGKYRTNYMEVTSQDKGIRGTTISTREDMNR